MSFESENIYDPKRSHGDSSSQEITSVDAEYEVASKAVRDLAYSNNSLRLVRIEEFESPLSLSASDFEEYARRFVTLFIDENRSFVGGNGKVIYAENSCGEALALKFCLSSQSEQSLRHEYEIQRSLYGIKGIPKVYGWGMLEENAVIIMEWIEGITLSHACQSLAVDEDKRLSPLTAARLGRDLFDLLSRMDVLEGEFVHRDISPMNILVRTSRLSVIEQAEEGVFDLCLIDFGSAVHYGNDSRRNEEAPCEAVPAYAAPELLDMTEASSKAKTSPLVDVYAATSVLYEMVCGHVPYHSYLHEAQCKQRANVDEKTIAAKEAHSAEEAYVNKETDSEAVAEEEAKGKVKAEASDLNNFASITDKDIFTCELKTNKPIDPIVMAHRAADDIGVVLSYEPEVAVVASLAASEFSLAPDAGEVREALAMVDEQLEELIEAGLQPNPSDRPLAMAMRDALATFVFQYADNVGRALRGEPLVSCLSGSPASGFGGSPLRIRNVLRSVGKAASAAVWMVAVVATGVLVGGADATFGFGQETTQGQINGIMVSCALALPGILGLALRGKSLHSLKGFIRGSVGLLLGTIAVVAASFGVEPSSQGITQGLYAALFAAVAAGWCPLVVDFALAALPVRRRKLLKAAAERFALESGLESEAIVKTEKLNQQLTTDNSQADSSEEESTINDGVLFEVVEDIMEENEVAKGTTSEDDASQEFSKSQRKEDSHDGK